MAEELEGVQPDTLPGEKEQGQESLESDSPTESLEEKVLKQAAEKTDESAASEKGKEKPLPFDQNPKWKKARAAEARVDKIIEKYGYDDIDELEAALDEGNTISELIGKRDAKKLIEDSQTLEKYREYWKEQKLKEQEAEETPDERADRLAKELKVLKQQTEEKDKTAKEKKALAAALVDYENVVENIVGQQKFSKEEAEMASLLLGVKNPFNVIDIEDKLAVKKMAKENTAKFKTFVDKIRQEAIDEYSKGKSKFIPISPTVPPAKESVSKQDLPKDASVDDVFSKLQKTLIENLSKGMGS